VQLFDLLQFIVFKGFDDNRDSICRQKFFNYHFGCDSTTLFGLPDPIHQSVAALRRHLYVPLSDLQVRIVAF
jgi:hypothetical protein